MDLSQTFDQLGLAEIDDYLKREQEEHLQLDFKTIKGANLASADDRRNFARGLSGFANSAGGIIVWGIDARNNAQGIDCAVAPSEIRQLKLLLSRLNEFTGQAVSPIVDGVRHKIIERTADSGFAVTLVPESQSAPHMAKLGEDRYYKRSGASFYKMEHFDLEDMFGRRQKPLLRMSLTPTNEDDTTKLVVRLKNVGRRTARHAGFMLKFENAEVVGVSGDIRNVSHLNDRPVVTFDYPAGVIHPNGIDLIAGEVHLRSLVQQMPVAVSATIYCEDALSQNAVIEIPIMST
jgi:hypothetical protein